MGPPTPGGSLPAFVRDQPTRSSRSELLAGEKVNAQWTQAAPGTVQVTLTSAKFGVGWSSRRGSGVDRLSDELSGLLPHAG